MNSVTVVVLLLLAATADAFAPTTPSLGRAGGVADPRPGGSAAVASRPPATVVVPSALPPWASPAAADLEAILFDCDGVLADTERDGHRPAFNEAFALSDLDCAWDEDRYGKLLEVGGGKERMTAHWDEVGWPDAIPVLGRAEKVMNLHLTKTEIFMKMIEEGAIPLRPGVLRLVDEAIGAGVRLAVCSTSNEMAVRGLVKTLMGEDRAAKFQIFAGDMVKKKKPAPDVYLMAVDEMGLDKDRCVIIEDSHIGVGAAVAAGISCLVTKSSYTADEDFTGAKVIVEELGDDAATGVTLRTLTSLLPVDPSSGTREVSWSGARYGDRQGHPTPSRWHE
ncbi:hypothetical protein ACHAWF_006517 [Thalassiosira exigua]